MTLQNGLNQRRNFQVTDMTMQEKIYSFFIGAHQCGWIRSPALTRLNS